MGNTSLDSDQELTGKVAIITGAARGIGESVARLLAARGASVVIADVAQTQGRALAEALGAGAIYQHLNVADEAAWARVVSDVVVRYGRIDALINCAGILLTAAIIDMDRTAFKRVLDVNLKGTFLGMKHAAPAMAKTGGGSIVNLSSTEGLQGANSMAAYASSKWGVRGLTKVAAMELGQDRIRVNSVHPGPINTPMLNPKERRPEELSELSMLSRMPIPRIADASEVAELCAYLVSDRSKFVTGAEIAIDGGLTAGNFIPSRPGAPLRAP